MVMQYATENIIPVTLELGGKSPNVFFPSVMDADDEFLDKATEGTSSVTDIILAEIFKDFWLLEAILG
jgi:acyl-CoA reductase-like NAD-dependent aldehyde dehydrogenase